MEEKEDNYVRMLLVKYTSTSNTIVPSILIPKLVALGLNIALCSWITDFLTGRPQTMNVGNNTSFYLFLNMGTMCAQPALLLLHQ